MRWSILLKPKICQIFNENNIYKDLIMCYSFCAYRNNKISLMLVDAMAKLLNLEFLVLESSQLVHNTFTETFFHLAQEPSTIFQLFQVEK